MSIFLAFAAWCGVLLFIAGCVWPIYDPQASFAANMLAALGAGLALVVILIRLLQSKSTTRTEDAPQIERTDDEIRNAFVAYLESLKGKGVILIGNTVLSPKQLADALRANQQPLTKDHIRMARNTARRLGKDPVLFIQGR